MFDLFSNSVGHFGAPWRPFLILLAFGVFQAVRHCRLLKSATGTSRFNHFTQYLRQLSTYSFNFCRFQFVRKSHIWKKSVKNVQFKSSKILNLSLNSEFFLISRFKRIWGSEATILASDPHFCLDTNILQNIESMSQIRNLWNQIKWKHCEIEIYEIIDK